MDLQTSLQVKIQSRAAKANAGKACASRLSVADVADQSAKVHSIWRVSTGKTAQQPIFLAFSNYRPIAGGRRINSPEGVSGEQAAQAPAGLMSAVSYRIVPIGNGGQDER
ncbi:MAG TPA: hypothetical protein VNZ94_01395 [Xanthobacteraceae bacterium]|nr:hypothetical protein [Xanthobacteraceae bacterium]